ncbi:uncharacterized protein LOC118417973 [Branchiostoma floridae]|uniref:Uncharacterized protein LOC118417973 n=1 Tax=Branchiostoma floridae TaxID=7739 RepID=A0A9J7MUQ7_BRAFL|nr:uncharacterized protein LOC118417973 [Branchiostoma floridae]
MSVKMAQSSCPSDKTHSRRERLARSTYVSQLVSSFEALTGQPCITPVQTLADADQVLISRSVQERKDELLGKTSSTPSEATVVSVRPQKPPSTKSLNVADTKSASSTEPQKPPRTNWNSLADKRDAQPAVEVRQEELLRTLVLGDTTAHATVTVKPASRIPALPVTTAHATVTVKAGRTPTLSDTGRSSTLPVTAALKTEVPVTLVESAQTQLLADAAQTRPTESTPVLQPPPKPARCKDFVLSRNNVGHFGFALLTTLAPDLEPVHVIFQAADSIATLPVGRNLSLFTMIEKKS